MLSDPCIRVGLNSNRDRKDKSLSWVQETGHSFQTARSGFHSFSTNPYLGRTIKSTHSSAHESSQISFSLSNDTLPCYGSHIDMLDSLNALVDRVNTLEYRLSDLEGTHKSKTADEAQSTSQHILSILYRMLKFIRSSALRDSTAMIPNGTTGN
jgi:hypothetical protein